MTSRLLPFLRRLALILPLAVVAAESNGDLDDFGYFVPARESTASLVIVVDEASCSWLVLAPDASSTPVFGTRIRVRPGGVCEVAP